ncbi:hypothetical protein POM88_013964 [Heracleum sosnowskyi]|uniref:Uncharacterized protein n=1 Tax=Heracleum sosnowskyi TaxID=360622 RepID=A0AAD8N4X2_9APIA|nr:hypothetical protein POM88_013964 [Heracleum sosnowskyi]
MLNLRSLVARHLTYDVSDNSRIFFWLDPWFEHKPLIDRFNPQIISISETSETLLETVYTEDRMVTGMIILEGQFVVASGISKPRQLLSLPFLSVPVHSLWKERNDRMHTPAHVCTSSQIRNQVQCTVRDRVASSMWFQKKVLKDPALIMDFSSFVFLP